MVGMPQDLTILDHLSQDELWDAAAAARYDTPGTGMFAPEVLGPTVERLVELAEGGPALELAVGTGRVAVPLLRRGVPVTGIEASAPMLARLRQKVDEQALPVVLGDMADTRVAGEFSLVYLVFNTLANLLTQEAQVACFRNAAAHLRPGGRFVVELWVPDLLGPDVPAQVFAARQGYVALDVMDRATQRVISHHFTFDDALGGDTPDPAVSGEGRTARLSRTPHRFAWPGELDLMARLAGLEPESRHEDWSGTPFTSRSRSHVSVWRRP